MANEQSSTSDRELLITRTINAPIELVWEVWTQPEHISKWWGPNGFSTDISVMDVEAGGAWDLVMLSPDGTVYPNRSVFREVIPFKKLVYDHISHPHFTATVEFEALGEQTFLKWQMLFESAELLRGVVKAHNAAEGLKQNVAKLDAYLQNRKAGL
ncbi:SRPBCC family protein [Dyadobacter luticola]|uniref:Polyketide cyclase n=1 Tax=Dyadobacter luticola TaxID=1979387 RepID=A0A5R9L5Q0_9BACT|nr:SRPBCC family protein [Dyadobacter luticola]TLV03731.1 polyketide cyclase [Dyadobacter luticola]